MQQIVSNKEVEYETVIANLTAENKKLSSDLQQALTQINYLLEQAKLSKHRVFGKQTEASNSLQGELFDESMSSVYEPEETETITYDRKKSKKQGRLIDTSNLPKDSITYDLSEQDKICDCGATLHKIGDDISSQIDYIPASLKVIEHIKAKYSCKQCQSVKSANKPEQPLGKCMATERFVADVITKKYEAHLPLYRQSQILAREGATIPDNTLGNWVASAADALAPIGNALWQQLRCINNLQADESPVKVLKPDKQGYMWAYNSPSPNNRFIIFEFSLTRSASVPNNRLSNYSGILQTDAYGGYNGFVITSCKLIPITN